MSFPKGPIRRFNEGSGCAPPPGSYDPKFDTDVAVSAKKGKSSYSLKRFPESRSKTLTGPIPFPFLHFGPNSNLVRSSSSTSVHSVSSCPDSSKKLARVAHTRMKEALEQKTTALDELEVAFLDSQNDLEKKEDELLIKGKNIFDLKTIIAELQDDLGTLRQQANTFEATREEFDKEMLEKSEQLIQEQGKHEELTAEHNKEIILLKEVLAQYLQQIELIKQEISQMQKVIKSKEEMAEDDKLEIKAQKALNLQMRENLSIKKNEIEELGLSYSQLQSENTEQAELLKQLRYELTRKVEEAVRVQQTQAELQIEIEEKLSELEAINGEQTKKLTDQQTVILTTRNCLEDGRDENEQLRETVKHLQSDLDLNTCEIQDCKNQLRVKRDAINQLNELLALNTKSMEEVEAHNSELEETVKSLESGLTSARDVRLVQQLQILDLTAKLESETHNKEEALDELSYLRGELQKLTTEMIAFKNMNHENRQVIIRLKEDILLKSGELNEIEVFNSELEKKLEEKNTTISVMHVTSENKSKEICKQDLQITELKEDIHVKVYEFERLEQDIKELQNNLQIVISEVEQRNIELTEKDEAVVGLKEEVESKMTEIGENFKETDRLKIELQKLTAEVNTFKNMNDESSQVILSLKEDILLKSGELHEIEIFNTELEKELEEKNTIISVMNVTSENKSKEIYNQDLQVTKLKEDIHVKVDELERLGQQILELNDELEEKNTTIVLLNGTSEKQIKDICTQDLQITKFKDDINVKVDELGKLDEEIKELRDNLQIVISEIKQRKVELTEKDEAIVGLKEEVKSKMTEIGGNYEEIDKLKIELQKLTAEVNTFKNMNEERSQVIISLKEDILLKSEELNEIEVLNLKLEKELEERNTTIAVMNVTSENKSKEICNQDLQITKLKEDIHAKIDELERLEQEILELNDELEEKNTTILLLNGTSEKQIKDICTQDLQITELKEDINVKVDEVGKLDEEIKELRDSLQIVIYEIEQRKVELIEKDKAIVRLKEEVESKMTEIGKNFQEMDRLKINSQTKHAELEFVRKVHETDRENFKTLTKEYIESSEVMRAKIVEAYETKCEIILTKRENDSLNRTLQDQSTILVQKSEQFKELERHCQRLGAKLDSQSILSRNLQSRLEEKDCQAGEADEEMKKLKLSFINLNSEKEKLTVKLQNIESLMEPFKEQLQAYKIEMMMEKEGKMANETQCKEIFAKYAELLGHQNKKQKIHHIIKLKEDNLKARKEVETLRHDLTAAKKHIGELERARCAPQRRRFDAKTAFKIVDNDNEKENTVLQTLAQ